jgi:murein DD-endopeptidase MepM/ murein hydrolase activator NlpD
MILINHGNGFLTRYGHLSAFNVEVGDSVKKGQIIGRVGSTGNSTGPHLHFEVIRNSIHMNPFGYLR